MEAVICVVLLLRTPHLFSNGEHQTFCFALQRTAASYKELAAGADETIFYEASSCCSLSNVALAMLTLSQSGPSAPAVVQAVDRPQSSRFRTSCLACEAPLPLTKSRKPVPMQLSESGESLSVDIWRVERLCSRSAVLGRVAFTPCVAVRCSHSKSRKRSRAMLEVSPVQPGMPKHSVCD